MGLPDYPVWGIVSLIVDYLTGDTKCYKERGTCPL
jgi:hypothetical protein